MDTKNILNIYVNAAESIGYTLTEESKHRLSEKASDTTKNWQQVLNQPIISKDDIEEFTGQLIDALEDELSKSNEDSVVIIKDANYDKIMHSITQSILSQKY